MADGDACGDSCASLGASSICVCYSLLHRKTSYVCMFIPCSPLTAIFSHCVKYAKLTEVCSPLVSPWSGRGRINVAQFSPGVNTQVPHPSALVRHGEAAFACTLRTIRLRGLRTARTAGAAGTGCIRDATLLSIRAKSMYFFQASGILL